MMSSRNIRIHGPADSSFCEQRIVDGPDLRLAEFTAPTRPACIGILRDRLMQAFGEFGIESKTGTAQICMALEEALANAFYHGNLELDSALKEDGSDTFTRLAKERCDLTPWKDRRIHILELATPIGVWITIGDEGTGFDTDAAMKRTEDPLSILASGRGLVMMKAFTDELLFNRTGNEVTLVVYHNRNTDVGELIQQRLRKRRCDTNKHPQH